jgi:CDP-glucose 4,6-dehydratase
MYGGGDLNWSRIVPGTVCSILRGERPVIRSDGSLVRDYLYVRDAAAGVLSLAAAVHRQPEAFRGEAFNFAGGGRLSVRDIVNRMLGLMGSALEPIVEGRHLPEIQEQRVSAAKARRLLGWRPETPLERGLLETIGWYTDYFKART